MPRPLAAELRAMGVREDVIATTRIHGKLLSEYERTSKRSDAWGKFKSKWEILYSMELDDQKRARLILDWQYEGIRLRLTEPSVDAEGKKIRPIVYTPDFDVWLPDRRLRFVEVKGYRRTKDMNRYKVAKDVFPHAEFVMVSRKAGGWEVIM